MQAQVSKSQLSEELKQSGISLNSERAYVRWVLRDGTVVFDKFEEFRTYFVSHWGFPPPSTEDWHCIVPAFDC